MAMSATGRIPIRLRGLADARVLGRRVPVADRPRARLLGLALIRRARAGPGLLIPRCRSVHTFGMRFALDVAFLDRSGRAIAWRRGVPPGRFLREPGAEAALELPAEPRR